MRRTVELLDRRADDQAGQRGRCEVLLRQRARVASVAQRGGAVGDAADLAEPVGHQDDARPPVTEPGHDLEQPIGLPRFERRRRLVEEQEPRPLQQRAGDLDQLPLGGVQTGDLAARVDVDPEVVEQFPRGREHPFAVDQARASRGMHRDRADVLADGEVREQVVVLVDDPDAGRLRVARGREVQRPSIDGQRPVVRLQRAGEHPDERALAGAVLAHQCVHLAGADIESDVVQCGDPAVPVGDARGREAGRTRLLRPAHGGPPRAGAPTCVPARAASRAACPRSPGPRRRPRWRPGRGGDRAALPRALHPARDGGAGCSVWSITRSGTSPESGTR